MRTGTAVRYDENPEETAPTFLRLGRDGRLWYTRGEDSRPVTVRRCFPWSEPGRYVSLRDDEGEELLLVASPAELDTVSRDALEAVLAESGFLFEVTAVLAVEDEVELRDWRVETRQGPRRFQTRLDEWPRPLPGGGYRLRDVAGDLYRIPDPAGLDRRSRALLGSFID